MVFQFHTDAARLALACIGESVLRFNECLSQLDATPGHQLSIAAMSTFGDRLPEQSFREMAAMRPFPEDYQLAALARRRDRVADLLAGVESAKAASGAVDIVREFLPEAAMDAGAAIPVDVYLVAVGHALGDAYIRYVVYDRGHWAIDANAGVPVILVNLTVVADTYPGDHEQVVKAIFSVLAHELFHCAFHRYLERALPDTEHIQGVERFLDILVDEGIAHYVDRVTENEGAPWLFPRDRAAALMEQMEAAVSRLLACPSSARDIEEVIVAATTGPYWKKFGSMGGCLLVAAIDERGDRQCLREIAAANDARLLLATYERCRSRGLPELGPCLRAIAKDAAQ